MQLSAMNAQVTRWTFALMLLKRAYTSDQLQQMAKQSRFGRAEITPEGIGLEFRLMKNG